MAAAVQAELYRSVDEHGNVSYSDVKSDGAQIIELKELTTYTPVTTEVIAQDKPDPDPEPYLTPPQ